MIYLLAACADVLILWALAEGDGHPMIDKTVSRLGCWLFGHSRDSFVCHFCQRVVR